jgi:hypothetical protein
MATNPVSYPLAMASVSGTTITVDQLIQQPSRITRYLNDLTLRGMFANQIFSNGGGVTGGGLIYDQLTSNQLFPSRDVQNVEPGTEFPIITSDRLSPKYAPVEKFGGKFFVTDEARDRNDPATIRVQGQQLANAIARRIDSTALATLDAAVTEFSRTATGVNWSAVVTGGSTQTNASGWPAADFAKAQLSADQSELGVRFNTWIVNPAQANTFRMVYGSGAAAVLNDWGVNLIPTNRVTAGTAYVVEAGMVGQMRLEKGLTTETWRDPDHQRTWFQSDVRPVFAVTNPYSVLKITGLAG